MFLGTSTGIWVTGLLGFFIEASLEKYLSKNANILITICHINIWRVFFFNHLWETDSDDNVEFIYRPPQVFREVQISPCQGFDQAVEPMFPWPLPYGALSVYLAALWAGAHGG